MGKVLLKYRGPLRELTGRDADTAEAASVKDALKYIKSTYGADAYSTAKKMLIAVNGKSVLLLSNLRTPLSDGDDVSFLPIAGGG